MKRFSLLAATAAIALAATGVIATAHDGDNRRADTKQGRIEMILERFDADGDGTITRAEVDAHHAERFAAADTDGDGLLSAEELAAARDAMQNERRQVRSERRIERMIERLDANGDGLLSVEEMAAGGGRGGDMFDRLDRDADGAITQAELEEMRGGHGGDGHRGGGHGGDRRGGGHWHNR